MRVGILLDSHPISGHNPIPCVIIQAEILWIHGHVSAALFLDEHPAPCAEKRTTMGIPALLGARLVTFSCLTWDLYKPFKHLVSV